MVQTYSVAGSEPSYEGSGAWELRLVRALNGVLCQVAAVHPSHLVANENPKYDGHVNQQEVKISLERWCIH